ncbi:hypothetical protein [Ornithinimicrobium kibberense]|uniref:hypothetical protein n=1 Tax=Ornithinimicrobium kibberense TaxID=282060 RepID=UPI00361FBCBA
MPTPARSLDVAGAADPGDRAGQRRHLLLVGPAEQHRAEAAVGEVPVGGLADHLQVEPARRREPGDRGADHVRIPLRSPLGVDHDLDGLLARPGQRLPPRGRLQEGVAVAARTGLPVERVDRGVPQVAQLQVGGDDERADDDRADDHEGAQHPAAGTSAAPVGRRGGHRHRPSVRDAPASGLTTAPARRGASRSR